MGLQEKVNRLVAEIRTWAPGQSWVPTLNELCEKFDLEAEVVQRVAESEGLTLSWVDPDAITLDLDPDEIQEALEKPDPEYPDMDTGVWKKKPTGEWAQVSPKKS